KDRLNYEIMKPEDVGLDNSRIVLTARSGRHAFHHRLGLLGIKLAESKREAAWQRFLQVADTKREVMDDDLKQIAMAEPNGNGHATAVDAPNEHNHVADTLRHMIFG
ncbi:MAG TPA: hypothetical protein VNO87_02415, partial [Methylomirabilota bacterium]|nr:hypothetical protein [Methylomirabilota bacterium]